MGSLSVPQAGWWNVDLPYRPIRLTGRLLLGRGRVGPLHVESIGSSYRSATAGSLLPGLAFEVTVKSGAEVHLRIGYLEFPEDDRVKLVSMTEPSAVLALDLICPGKQRYLKFGPFASPKVAAPTK